MWSTFFLCFGICTLLLYIPGFFAGRALRLSPVVAIACAPIVTVSLYALVAVADGALGVAASWPSILIPVLALCGGAAVISRVLFKKKFNVEIDQLSDWAILLLYLTVGMIVCGLVYIKGLDGADSFYSRFDNQTHTNMVRYFLESGVWSSLQANVGAPAYPDWHGAFYPAAWHDIVALTASIAGDSGVVAANAVNAVVCGLVFPGSCYALLRSLFGNARNMMLCGAVASMAFVSFPWVFLVKGPVTSNLLSYALIPSVCSLAILLTRKGLRDHLPEFLIWAFLGCSALALSQPNGLFSAFVFLLPFALRAIAHPEYFAPDATQPRRKHPWLVYLIGTCVALTAWVGALSLPMFASIAAFTDWSTLTYDPLRNIVLACGLSFFHGQPEQWLLSIVCALGAVYLVRHKKRWLLIPAGYMLISYVVCRSTDSSIRALFAGFWYNDAWRMGECAAIFLVPVATCGLHALSQGLYRLIGHVRRLGVSDSSHAGSSLTPLVATLSVLIVFSVVNFCPLNIVPHFINKSISPFSFMTKSIEDCYDTSVEQVYSEDEKRFVEKVLSIIPKDSLVINQPCDGSVFAYGVNGLNTYFRSTSSDDLPEDAFNIQKGLAQIAGNSAVQDAVERSGAKYVLLLDQGVPFEEGTWLVQTNDRQFHYWDGINNITDDTPGLEPVLAEGDMRLYKIVE